MSKACNKLTLKKTLLVLCEGQTEYNYYDHYRKNKSFSFSFRPVDVAGGGYTKMLKAIKQSSPQGVIARFILLDMDRYFSHQDEQQVLGQIISYIQIQNKNGNPIFLVLSNPDFDEFVLLHDRLYTGNKNTYLPTVNYQSINDLKSDEKVYEKFNTKGRSYQIALQRLNPATPVKNAFTFTKANYSINNTLSIFPNNFVVRTSNISDLYSVVDKIIS